MDPQVGGGDDSLRVPAHELKYAGLAATIRRDIRAGTWAVGEKIPTEKELMATSGLSLTTVRRALQQLAEEGWIRRQVGAGSFVEPWVDKRERSTFLIGVMVPETRLYYDRVIQGVQDQLAATRAGSTLLATYEWDPDREAEALRTLLDAAVDGLVLTPHLPESEQSRVLLRELRALPVPVVLAERGVPWAGPGLTMEHVISDHSGGAYDAIAHLHRLGRNRVALAYRLGTNTTDAIVDGYKFACEDLGLEPWERELPSEHGRNVSPDDVHALADAMASDGITAILVFGDREAISLQNELHRRGLRVPADIAMVSYDDETADLAAVPLTAVAPAKYQLGKLAADIIVRRLRGGESAPMEQVKLRPTLVIRESCGGASAG
ncbi:substrate-binding domain-containing protein [Tessaracoccus terricola]